MFTLPQSINASSVKAMARKGAYDAGDGSDSGAASVDELVPRLAEHQQRITELIETARAEKATAEAEVAKWQAEIEKIDTDLSEWMVYTSNAINAAIASGDADQMAEALHYLDTVGHLDV